jgi:DNA mismatch repair protein MutS2
MTLLDERTLDVLDFASIRERVVSATRTERGRAFAEQMVPFADFIRIRREQAATSEIRELVASTDFHIRPAIDTSTLTETAALGRALGPSELRAIADAVAAAAAAHKGTRARVTGVANPAGSMETENSQSPIGAVTAAYAPLNDLVRTVTDAIDERGVVQDRASPALGRIRRAMAQAQAEARDRVGSIARSGNRAIQDSVVTLRDGRFVVPIKAEFSGEFLGIVHDTSSSGQTLFVEPLSALDANNRVRTSRLEEEREIARILEALSRLVGTSAAQIEANVEMLAQLDVLAAKTHVARSMDAHAPELRDDPGISVINGRHPLLTDRAIPQSLTLDDSTRVLVISGPNMGGKTVALKMVGLFVAMTYAGMHIPAGVGTCIGRFTRIVADIGDDQSIAANTSTFSAHLRRMQNILADANDRTLVLVDEIGGGTEPNSGAALAIAFLERLLVVRACAIVTTHATELKFFAHETPGVVNANVRFDPQTFAPTYHLDIGTPGQSLAFPLARSIGIPEAILERAQTLLESRERDYESALAELAQRSAELQAERDRLAEERRSSAEQASAIRAEHDALRHERARFSERAEGRMQQALREFAAEVQRRAAENDERAKASRPKVTPGQSAALDRTLAAMRRDLGIESSDAYSNAQAAGPDSATPAKPLEPGDRVYVVSLRQNGVLAEDYGDRVLVAFGPSGALKTVVPKSDVQRIGKHNTGAGEGKTRW